MTAVATPLILSAVYESGGVRLHYAALPPLMPRMRFWQARCLFRQSCASALLLGAPGSSPAPEATLERGDPRDNPGELVVDV